MIATKLYDNKKNCTGWVSDIRPSITRIEWFNGRTSFLTKENLEEMHGKRKRYLGLN